MRRVVKRNRRHCWVIGADPISTRTLLMQKNECQGKICSSFEIPILCKPRCKWVSARSDQSSGRPSEAIHRSGRGRRGLPLVPIAESCGEANGSQKRQELPPPASCAQYGEQVHGFSAGGPPAVPVFRFARFRNELADFLPLAAKFRAGVSNWKRWGNRPFAGEPHAALVGRAWCKLYFNRSSVSS
jgi:hypothetical protein